MTQKVKDRAERIRWAIECQTNTGDWLVMSVEIGIAKANKSLRDYRFKYPDMHYRISHFGEG